MDIPRYWRLRNQRYHLQGAKCEQCGQLYFPPRAVCPACKSRSLSAYRFKGTGRVYSHSLLYQSSDRFEGQAPYVVAIVELEEGVRLTAQLTDVDVDEVAVGMPVEMVVRKIYEEGDTGPIVYGYKFRPLFTRPD
ncbi:Zn-ribbon domain-containing OB-fold protein [Calditrichota bacterium GD2]